ncbi:MAG: hypothetical protein J7642_20880 [Cyanobacteria bacterium SBC]|nr:hypothetical protein [Cyanobacteria bacterium SBC]
MGRAIPFDLSFIVLDSMTWADIPNLWVPLALLGSIVGAAIFFATR